MIILKTFAFANTATPAQLTKIVSDDHNSLPVDTKAISFFLGELVLVEYLKTWQVDVVVKKGDALRLETNGCAPQTHYFTL